MAGTTMSLKLLVDSRGNQVVFGEASNDFVDFLFSLLRLPLSTVISLVKTDGIIGSIKNIYSSIQNMEDAYMASSESKSAILKPKGNSYAAIAKSCWHTRTLYRCTAGHAYVTHNNNNNWANTCPECATSTNLFFGTSDRCMSRKMKYVGPSSSKMGISSFVQSLVTYMVTDELSISPMSVVSGITLLKRYNLQLGDVHEKVVKFQVDHLELDFLECSLKSSDSVLTHIFLENKLHLHSNKNPQTGKTVSLKLLIDTINQKVIFAEAGKDFVDFLCSLLLFPLGTVIRRLTGDTPRRDMIGCIGNIYTSVQNLDEQYMQHNQSKDNVLMPDQSLNSPPNILFLLPKDDSGPGVLYTCSNNHFHFSDVRGILCPSCRAPMCQELAFFNHENETKRAPNVEGGYVRGLTTYTVTDDLCIVPLSLISGISTLSLRFSAQPVNLETRVVQFGISEGLNLLKASLQSKTALTDVYCKVDASS